MYSKQQASQLRQEFWTVFGQYMLPVLSSEGLKINWINYKTGVRNIAFRMNADHKEAHIAIELSHKDNSIRLIHFKHLLQFKDQLHEILGESWLWDEALFKDGYLISYTGTSITGISIYKKEDWPRIISFFKPRIIALDEFWNNVKYGFEFM